mgnify:CR=1 FL=1
MAQTASNAASMAGRSSVELRFHNPYRGWLKGLLTEFVVFAVFIIVVAALALVAFWIA